MNKEQKRLETMLKTNKISEADYQLISSALNKKSVFMDLENSMFINPFQKIAGVKALLIGLIIMIIMSGLGVIANVYYDGIIGFIMPVGLKIAMKPNFWLLLYQNAIGIIALALLFLAAAFLFKQKGIRAIDFLGTVALARYPLLISITLILLERLYQGSPVDDVSGTIELHFSIVGTISNLIFMACMIWQIMTYFFALREASGLEGKRLWYGFIIAILLGEVIGIILTRLFLYI